LELEALNRAAQEMRDLGAVLLAISPQQEIYNRDLIGDKKLTFTILSDPGNKVAERYGIRYRLADNLKEVYMKFGINLPEYNGDDSWTLPLPTRLIIDRDGILRYAEINADYTVRPDPEETIAALKKITDR
jgi:peroxiredoxin